MPRVPKRLFPWVLFAEEQTLVLLSTNGRYQGVGLLPGLPMMNRSERTVDNRRAAPARGRVR